MKRIDEVKTFLINNAGGLISVILIIFVVLFLLESIKSLSQPNTIPVVIQNTGKKANYSDDISFLECIGVQHSCIYENINSGNEKFIIENCKEEDFCILGKPIQVHGKRK